MVTLADIANRLGIDRSTVSLAINDATAQKLSPDRVKQIHEVASEMGYQPNLLARQLRRGSKTRCIGVVMNYLEYYPYNHYFNLISEYCSSRGYHAIPLPMKHRDGRSLDELELVENAAVDGLIVLEYGPATEEHLGWRNKPNFPVVFRAANTQQCPVQGYHRIETPYTEAVRDLIIQIVNRGWDRLYLVVERDSGRPNPFVDEHGLLFHESLGVSQAVRETGIELSLPDRIIFTPERRAKTRYDAISDFVSTHTFKPGSCLIHCGADGVSGTYAALINAGLRVGVDVAIAATNAIPPWEYVLPDLSCCYEYHEYTSRWLVNTMVELLQEKSPKQVKPKSHVGSFRIRMTGSVPQR